MFGIRFPPQAIRSSSSSSSPHLLPSLSSSSGSVSLAPPLTPLPSASYSSSSNNNNTININMNPSTPKIKCALTCSKREKKHQSFELIFICMEKSCADNFRPICAQCLHEDHSGHEIKLIKEIAEIANTFIAHERQKHWPSFHKHSAFSPCQLLPQQPQSSQSQQPTGSPYWDSLAISFNSLYASIEDIVRHLRGLQDTLELAHSGLFEKLHSEKNTFFEIIDSTAQKILKDKCYSEDDLVAKIRLILKHVDITNPISANYRHNTLKEDTVGLVLSNYAIIDELVAHAKEFVMSSLVPQQLRDAYAASDFRIAEDDEYMRITTTADNSHSTTNIPDEILMQQQQSRILQVDEDQVQNKIAALSSSDDQESQPDHDLYHDYDDDDEENDSDENHRRRNNRTHQINFDDDDDDDQLEGQRIPSKGMSSRTSCPAAIASSKMPIKPKYPIVKSEKKPSSKKTTKAATKNDNSSDDSDDFDLIQGEDDAKIAANKAQKKQKTPMPASSHPKKSKPSQENSYKARTDDFNNPNPIDSLLEQSTRPITLNSFKPKPLSTYSSISAATDSIFSRIPQSRLSSTSTSASAAAATTSPAAEAFTSTSSSYLSRVEGLARSTADKNRYASSHSTNANCTSSSSDIHIAQKESDYYAGIDSRSDPHYKPFKADYFLEGVRGIFDKGLRMNEPTRTRAQLSSDSPSSSLLAPQQQHQNTLSNYDTDTIFEKFRKISTKQEEAQEKLRKFQDQLKRGGPSSSDHPQIPLHSSPSFGSIPRQPATESVSNPSTTSPLSSYSHQPPSFFSNTTFSTLKYHDRIGDGFLNSFICEGQADHRLSSSNDPSKVDRYGNYFGER